MSKSAPPGKRLGRGLDSLIGRAPERSSEESESPYRTVSVERIQTVRQPRTKFEEEALNELAASIRASGILQPLVVRRTGGGRYLLIAGERRLRAARMAGLDSVPVVIRDVAERDAFALALVENVQRRDLGPMEEAEAFRYLIEEQGFAQAEIAEKVGCSRSAVANSVRLLRLPPTVQRMIADGDLTAGHGRAILSLPDEKLHPALAERIVSEELNVREAEALAKEVAAEEERRKEAAEDPEAKSEPGEAEPSAKELRAQLKAVQDRMRAYLQAKVTLRQKLDGSGSIEVRFADDEELKGIVDRILAAEGLG